MLYGIYCFMVYMVGFKLHFAWKFMDSECMHEEWLTCELDQVGIVNYGLTKICSI